MALLIAGLPFFVVLLGTVALVLVFFMNVPTAAAHQVMFGALDKYGRDLTAEAASRFDFRPAAILERLNLRFNPVAELPAAIGQLQSLPEPLRSQMLYGDFKAGMEDDADQVIPTAWIDAAMDRWAELAVFFGYAWYYRSQGWAFLVLDAPDDVCDLATAPAVPGSTYRAAEHSVVLLVADLRSPATDG